MDLRGLLIEAVANNPLLDVNEESEVFTNGERAIGLAEGQNDSVTANVNVSSTISVHRLTRLSTPSLKDARDYAASQPDNIDYRIDLRLSLLKEFRTAQSQAIAEAVIDMLDERGYFVGNPSAIAMKCHCSVESVNATLDHIQLYFHNGIGARNAIEAVCLQLPETWRTLASDVLTNNLRDMKAGHYYKIAKEHGISEKRLFDLLAELKSIELVLPSLDENNATAYVYPDIIARVTHGCLEVTIPGREPPPLRMSNYLKLLNNRSISDEDRFFISKKAREAQDFLSALDARTTLLENFAHLLIQKECDFLTTETARPRPLRMDDVAEQLGVSTSTVSRLCKNKFIQTGRGLLPFGYFFKKSFVVVETPSGQQALQSDKISQLVESMIANEDPTKPLSDQQIAENISKTAGIVLARRTVAKYRSNAGIPNSTARRKQ